MSKLKWVGNRVEISPPKKPKKITGTRFGAILGVNKWSTPFKAWCEITKTYQEPFEGSIFTEAGKIIEPKQASYMKNFYGMSDLVTPEDMFGKDYFNKTFGDFFHDNPIFGGMWDYILVGEDGKPYAVLEMKTSKRVEDWVDDVPEYYSLQASLYAYLLGVDQVYMVATFLENKDYEDPNAFECNMSNTKVIDFKVSEKYPDFEDKIAYATTWWNDCVNFGISPEFDEKKDKDILTELRAIPTVDDDVMSLCARAEELEAAIKPLADELSELKEIIKEKLYENMLTDGSSKCILKTPSSSWVLSKSTKTSVDSSKLKEDGLYEQYTKTSENLILRREKKND
ncbi:MAG: YqaJ viral recombinase family protein [Lachnospiraceae bacterium]|nr:YqaJ viral recombinase family protein [Lachnospiraceae bacterium]